MTHAAVLKGLHEGNLLFLERGGLYQLRKRSAPRIGHGSVRSHRSNEHYERFIWDHTTERGGYVN
jgi:hypothetical protein